MIDRMIFHAEFLGVPLVAEMSKPSPIKLPLNLIFSPTGTGASPAPLFQGEQRDKARTVLAAKIIEHQVMSVLQLVNKDPSLALGTVPLTVASGGVSRVEEVDFAFACMRNDILPGCVFAISAGYAIDTPTAAGYSLLDLAISKIAEGGAKQNVGLLLAMGANPNGIMQPTEFEPGTFATAMMQAYPPATKSYSGLLQHPGVISMLLDAKANPVYNPNFKSPILILVGAQGWDDPIRAGEHTMMMARLVKAGASLDALSGSPRTSPLMNAIGAKNGNALISLIRMGASATSETLKGKDLFTLMDANKMQDFKPGIQSALMERVIAKAVGSSAQPENTSGDADDQARSRRRMGAI